MAITISNKLARRTFIRNAVLSSFCALGLESLSAKADWVETQLQYFKGKDKLTKILQKASVEK
jgi:hypothetical protein